MRRKTSTVHRALCHVPCTLIGYYLILRMSWKRLGLGHLSHTLLMFDPMTYHLFQNIYRNASMDAYNYLRIMFIHTLVIS